MDDLLNGLQEAERAKAAAPDPTEEFARQQFQTVVEAVERSSKLTRAFLDTYKPAVSVTNLPDSIKTPDVADVTNAVKALEKTLKPSKQDNSDVVKAVSELKKAIQSLELNPTYKPEITVSPTPVTVKAPVVKVEKPDLSPLQKAIVDNKPEPVDFSAVLRALRDVKKAVDTKPTPVANTPTDPLIMYAETDIDDVDASNLLKTVRYYGYTDTRNGWYIKKLDVSGIGTTGKSIRYTMGSGSYATNWTNRASLTYTTWGS